jgi:acetyl/propionyl-CoA carboxylase alpha subunit
VEINIRINGVEKKLILEGKGDRFRFSIGEMEYDVAFEPLSNGAFTFFVGNRSYVAYVSDDGGSTHLAIGGRCFRIEKEKDDDRREGSRGAAHADGKVESPMPGNIIKVNVKEGDAVEADQAVVVIESMKMQNEIPAPVSGRVARVSCAVGDQVSFGDVLVEITPGDET